MKNFKFIISAVIAFTLLSGCASHPRFTDKDTRPQRKKTTEKTSHEAQAGEREVEPELRVGFSWVGYASYYGQKFHGRRTSNGEIYDMNGISMAHKTLPFGTILEVVNLSNNKKLQIRVNDRGPFIPGRDADVSLGAANKLDMVREGVVKVRLTIVSLGED